MTIARATGVAGREPLRLPRLRMSLSTLYAWSRILQGYRSRHPRHQVRIFYLRKAVRDLRGLVRYTPQLDPDGFEVQVETETGDSADVVTLLRLLEEAAGPQVQRFLIDDNPGGWFSGQSLPAG